MKSVKRQTRASGIEAEQNEANERKKARLANHNGDSSKKTSEPTNEYLHDIPDVNSEQLHDIPDVHSEHLHVIPDVMSDTNGESDYIAAVDRTIAALNQPKTSTPIAHNGSFNNNNNIAERFNNTSALPQFIPFPSPSAMDVDPEVTNNVESNEECNGDEPPVLEQAVPCNDDQSKDDIGDVVQDIEVPSLNKEETTVKEVVIAPKSKDDVDLGKPKFNVDYFFSLLNVTELEGHADKVLAVAVDGDVVLSASQDTTIKMWNCVEKKEICNFQGHTGSVNALLVLTPGQSATVSAKMGFTNCDQIIVSGSTDCSIRFWSMAKGCELSSIYTYNGITCLGWMDSCSAITVGTDGGKLELWDLSTSKAIHSVVAHDGPVTDLKVDDNYIYTTSSDGKVKVWLLEEDDLIAIYSRSRKVPGPDGEMHAADWKCVDFQDNRMYLGDNTSDIKLLNWQAGRLTMMRNQIQPNGFIDSICVKNNILLSSSFDPSKDSGAINAWQLPDLTYISTLSGEVGRVHALDLTSNQNGDLRIISGGSKLLLWDFISSQPPQKRDDDKFFCQEIEKIGEDTSVRSIATSVDTPDGNESGKWRSKCTIL